MWVWSSAFTRFFSPNRLKAELHTSRLSPAFNCTRIIGDWRFKLDTRRVFLLTARDFESIMNAELLARAKSLGFSDRQIAHLTGRTEDQVRAERYKIGLVPSFRLVDTCAAEFEAYTPYYYSTYDRGDDEVRVSDTRKVMILGGGPNRIGQGIEFDYCCVHAAFALKEDGFETLMVNSNPETVST